jgi:stage II sporulation protein D
VTVRRLPTLLTALVVVAAGLAGPARADDATPDPNAPPATFAVVGAGFGHGVGMSQWGAYGMAQAGFDAAGIVTHYYAGTTVAPLPDDVDVRVNLLNQVSSAKVRTEPLDPSGGAIEVALGASLLVGGPADEFRFGAVPDGVSITKITGGQGTDLGTAPSVTVRWAGTRTPGATAGGPTLLDVVGSALTLDSPGHRYRYGFLEIVPIATSGGTRLNVVNSVRVHDEYLYGISEVSSAWPTAALQAQVLAARSYALSKVEHGVRHACSCHVDDGGGPYYDQTFTGWIKASSAKGENWVGAVNATLASDTSGLTITYDGAPIKAFYSASSGGNTRSSEEAWGGTLPYAVSVPDPYINTDANPYRSWTVNVSQSQMAGVFGLGVAAKVDVTERTPSGAVKAVAATAPDGRVVTKSGVAFQNALGLRSSYVLTINGAGGPPLPGAEVPGETTPTATPAPAPAPDGPKVRPRVVSLTTPVTLTPRVARSYKVAGVVRPAKAGLAVWRQAMIKGEWHTVQRTRTNISGHYRFVIKKARHAGATRAFRVLVVRKGVVVGVSPEFTVAVRPRR